LPVPISAREERPLASGMTSDVKWSGGMTFEGLTGSGHTLRMDAASTASGQNQGARPMELLLTGLGGCTGMDVISMLMKMRQEVTGYEVAVSAERQPEHPKVFTAIVVEHIVRGRHLSEDAVRKAIRLSATKYCPASAMLGKAAKVEHRYSIVEEGAGTVADESVPQAEAPSAT
jgi:putative redox protein